MIEKFLYQPVSPFYISQGFGEDRLCISNADNKTLVGKDTNAVCPVGYRRVYEATNGHNGLDIPAYRWQPVYACHDGIVNEVQTEVERGLGIGIVSDEKRYFVESNDRHHYKTRYWHFISMDVHIGDKIKTGDFIGYADSTGRSTGDHVHLELKPVNIIDIENGVPVCNNVLQNNTHLGAVNPLTYMENISALKIAGVIRQISEITAKVADYIADLLRR